MLDLRPRPRLAALGLATFVGLAPALAACDQQPVGDLMGIYQITGELTENSCGERAVPAPDPLTFDVEIRRLNESEGLWIQSAPPGNSGSLDAEGEFEFRAAGSFDLGEQARTRSSDLLELDPLNLAQLDTFEAFEADPEQDMTCVLSLSEVARGTLLRDGRPSDASDAGAAEPDDELPGTEDLVGENQIEIGVAQGNCANVLASAGGVFDTLPCRTHYTLTGRLKR